MALQLHLACRLLGPNEPLDLVRQVYDHPFVIPWIRVTTMQPEPATQQLVGQIEEWRAAGVRNDVELQRIKQQVEQLKGTAQRAYAYMLLGMIACLRDDPETMRSNHETSVLLDPTNKVVNDNYCTSLLATGFLQEPLEREGKAFTESGENPDYAPKYTGALFSAGRIDDAIAIMKKTNTEIVGDTHMTLGQLGEWRDVLADCEVSDDEAQEAIETVYATMQEHGYYFHADALDYCHDESRSWLSLVVRPAAAGGLSEVMKLNDYLVEKVASGSYKAFETGALVARFAPVRSNNGG